MKLILIFLFVQMSMMAFGQTTTKFAKPSDAPVDSITFITILDIANVTKDGIYLNGYVVNIDYEKAKKLNGKTLRIAGKVSIITGLKNLPKEYDKDGNELIQQGRQDDMKYIESPMIEIIENKR
jgi:hypothetical protein